MEPQTPKLTVDAVIISKGKLVLIKRKNPPFKGQFALPGGFVDIGETVENAVIRESLEETGLHIRIIKLVGVYSEPSRDPRGHTVSVTYLAISDDVPRAGSDAVSLELFDIDELPEMAFDHSRIIEDAKDDIYGILSKM